MSMMVSQHSPIVTSVDTDYKSNDFLDNFLEFCVYSTTNDIP